MNANPSGSRTSSTGSWGISEARRAIADTAGPSRSVLSSLDVRAGYPGLEPDRTDRSYGGARHAKTVCRGAKSPRCAAQGRVGEDLIPRHVITHLVPQLLLIGENVRSRGRGASTFWLRGAFPASKCRDGPNSAASTQQAQPGECRTTHKSEMCGTELAQPGPDALPASACVSVQSRGKGVLAA